MHAFSILTIGIFVAGYSTARWDLVTRVYELAIFAWDHGVVTRTAKGFALLSLLFFLFILPIVRIATQETDLHPRLGGTGISAREQLKRRDAPRDSAPGVLVGFRNSKSDVFVVGVLQDVELRQVENALLVGTLLRHSPHDIQELLQRCGHSSVRALGSVNPKRPADQSGADLLTVHTDPSLRFPRLHHPDDALITMQVIVYDRPHPTRMQYLSLKPITLALGDKTKVAEWDVAFEELERAEERERKRKAHLVEKLKLHRVIAHPRTQKELALPMIIEQVNCSYELNALLQKNIGMIGRRMKRALSVSERVVESANNLWDYIWLVLHYAFRVWIWPIAAQLFIFGLITHRIMGEAVLQVLHWRPGSSDSPALKDISATAQQIDIRLQQSCYWPIQYLTLRRRKIDWESITNSHPEYIRFYNSLWLVANDVIMGIAVGTFIIENASFVAAQVDTIFSTWSVDGLRRMISWLMGWPGGLKLNTELAAFLGDLFLWVIDYWAGCISLLRPNLPALVQIIGFSAFAGATMPISIFSDLVSLLTLHIYSFYVASARIFHWQLTIIISLFHLFRGKKRNILRNRIDSCDYDLDQLLLGTILFTLQFFLLPTVFVFYLTFASARIAVIGLKAALEMGLACLNHFPLFAVMLRLKDPGRLPGGIYFELQNTTDASSNTAGSVSSPPTAYVLLKSIPLSLRAMFQPYFDLGDRIRKHYFSPSVLLCLVSGQFVPPIHRRNLYSLQYSMLPAKRASIGELWRKLTERSGRTSSHELNGYAAMPLRRDIQNGKIRKDN
ncbi:N-acetylglucosaminyl-phosphatidylinositol biosynthetic protein [Alternaria arborescens]|nr:N-acetylglucosaminyl-phosphatidylinositol biosynthetic protein [Alternaria arborescens]